MNPYLQKIKELQDVPVNHSENVAIHQLIRNNIQDPEIREYLGQLTDYSEYIYHQPPLQHRELNLLQRYYDNMTKFSNLDNNEIYKIEPTVKMIREHIKRSILIGIERRNKINEYLMAYINEALDKFDTYLTPPSLAHFAFHNLQPGILDRVDRFTLRKIRDATIPLNLREGAIPGSPSPSPKSLRSRSRSRSKGKGSKGGTRKQNN
jgi:hypothetical protein